ncbi:Ribosomal RNA small subunit methyltransferase NEP1 [Euphorbia peplus]|nr:Ribosomal RNA small subunit methyltransferase NEP1 [Euphorbia peplus]
MGRKLPHACSMQVSDSTNEEVIRKEEENTELELEKEIRPLKRHKGNNEDEMTELPGIPIAPSVKSSKSGVIFVLEKASLTIASVGRKVQILNPNEHATSMRKKKMNPYNYRPDIVHEALCQIMGSRLRMAGRLKAVYIKTDEGILIKVEPNAKIPGNLGMFCSMMAELLQKLSIKAKGKGGKLLRLVENPVTQYLPVNSRKIGLSYSSKKAVELRDYVNAINHDEDLVFVVGAMAHGKIDSDYTDDLISVDENPLTAAICLRHLCYAMERRWNIH